ncbi:MAG: CofH family radical SAM protein [Vampirovibrionia bacterium]
MSLLIDKATQSPIKDIAEKILNNDRISYDDAIRLYNHSDILTIGALADYARTNRAPEESKNYAYFINNYHINITNICEGDCKFCAYKKTEQDPEAYFMELDTIEKHIKDNAPESIKELHIVSALNKKADLNYYAELFKICHKARPEAHIQALTAVEVDYLAKLENKSPEEIFNTLKQAGLGSLPGGGAEIFNHAIRNNVCPNKISGERWLEIMEIGHNLGIKSNATMLTGINETYEHRVEHMDKIRTLQDKTHGFMTFIPLVCHYQNTELEIPQNNTGFDNLKDLAISRIYLDNIPHIKAFWIQLGLKLSQISLAFGVDDMDGTVVREKISRAAGANTTDLVTIDLLIDIIKNANRIPVERNTIYDIIEIYK